ncbi:MAG: prepilin-type N-terminal cleavage/methylation domain-containing protein [Bradymonadales bacterium]|nr:prepilin-type N-terminal cleavage/methylation domain-containing protein [Bradymonadales bacterium]
MRNTDPTCSIPSPRSNAMVAKDAAFHTTGRRFGFTLVELMIAVTIVAVLTTIGAYAYGRIVRRSRINQAVTFFAAVAGAQTAYYSTYGQYCSQAPLPPQENDYDPPKTAIRAGATAWSNPDPLWQHCGIRLPSNTWFQYVMTAGTPQNNCLNPPDVARDGKSAVQVPACSSIANGTFWYYVVGRADQDGDGFMSAFGSSSTMTDTHWSIEGIELE